MIWHIWDEISFLFSHSILFSLRRHSFFISPILLVLFCFLFCGTNKTKNRRELAAHSCPRKVWHIWCILLVVFVVRTQENDVIVYCKNPLFLCCIKPKNFNKQIPQMCQTLRDLRWTAFSCADICFAHQNNGTTKGCKMIRGK